MGKIIILNFCCFFTLGGLFAVDYPLTTTDDAGQTVLIKKWPAKILSFTVFSDEILFDLVSADRFAAVTVLAADTRVSNVALKAGAVSRKVEFNVESVLSLRPDLVIVADWSDKDKVSQIRSMGIPVYLIKTPVDLMDVKKQIRKLAYITGVQSAGEGLIHELDRKMLLLNQIVERNRTFRKPDRTPRIMDYNPWGASSGSGTSWNTIIKLCGLENAATDYKADPWGQVPISKELLITSNPDILVLPAWTYDGEKNAQDFQNSVLQDPSLKRLRAVQENRVYVFPEKYKSTVSHYMVDAALALAEFVW